MTSLRSLAHQPWHRLLSVLLALIMVVTPLVSTMAELHESEHVTLGDHHLNISADHDIDANQDPDNDTDESSLHFLAHASHCCGHIVALLPHIQHLVLAPIQSALNIKREHSRGLFLRISHFRPPIFV